MRQPLESAEVAGAVVVAAVVVVVVVGCAGLAVFGWEFGDVVGRLSWFVISGAKGAALLPLV
jgi:hypothetical protein